MKFEWDPGKNQSNLEKHGVDFEEARTVFDDILAVIIEDRFHSTLEKREIIVGQSLRYRLLYAVFTEQENRIRKYHKFYCLVYSTPESVLNIFPLLEKRSSISPNEPLMLHISTILPISGS